MHILGRGRGRRPMVENENAHGDNIININKDITHSEKE